MNATMPIPENESLRIKKLSYYDIMHTEAEEMFDNLTKLAAEMLDVPICLIGLVDEDKVWFKSKVGVDHVETERETSFCQHAIMGSELLEVNNALEDERFKNIPLVASAGIRFYAGSSLIDDDGMAIGTFCALDSVPRELTPEKRKSLKLISETVMKLITLRRKKIEAEKLARVKDEFLSNMSHEIRTPLNAIIGFNDLLSKTFLTKEQRDYLETVSVSSQNLKIIINDILDVSKLESGNLQLERKPISLNKLMKYVVKLQGHMAKEKGIKLLCSMDHEMPEYVLGDETRLTQIFINLVNNAIKFTEKGYVELRAMVMNTSNSSVNISFSVRDTGIGISEDKLKSIFNRFSQAETSTTRLYGGTGLGLNIVQMLVNLHKGKIEVKSEREKGSEFEFQIDFEIAKEIEEREIITPIEKDKQAVFDGYNILLVEDNVHNQLLAKNYYKRWGAIIDIAENGQVALDMILEKNYDVIVMDLQMPVMDGFTTTTKIREELCLANIPIIGCSAHSLVGEKEKCIALGMNDYIAKPYSEDELIQTTLKYKNLTSKEKPVPVIELSETVFDDFETLIKDLTTKEGDEYVEAIKSHFQKRAPNDIIEIENALKEDDMKLLIQKSHLLTGSFGVFGFKNGRKLSKLIEQTAKKKDVETAKSLGFKLIVYLEEALLTMK